MKPIHECSSGSHNCSQYARCIPTVENLHPGHKKKHKKQNALTLPKYTCECYNGYTESV